MDNHGKMKKWLKKKADTAKSYVKKVVDSFVQKTISKILPGKTSNVLKTLHYDVRANANGKHLVYSQLGLDKKWTEVSEDQTKYHNNGIGNTEKNIPMKMEERLYLTETRCCQ